MSTSPPTVEMYPSAIMAFTVHTYDIDLLSLTSKTFSAMPTRMINPSTKYRYRLTNGWLDGQPNVRPGHIMPAPPNASGRG